MDALTPSSGVDFFGTVGIIEGHVADGFEPVAEAAYASLATGGDLGLQLSVFLKGRPVVGLYGGFLDAERTDRLGPRTLTLGFSVSKGILGLCIALLVESGQLDLDAAVAAYWPEFAAADKARVSVRDLLNHRAGLPAFDRSMSVEDLLDWDLCVSQLAAQRPSWVPGTRHGYHALTIGFLAGELIRRVTGDRPAEFFAQAVAVPLGLEGWFGVPADRAHDMRARLPLATAVGDSEPYSRLLAAAPAYAARAVQNPPIADLDTHLVWGADIPAVSFVATAEALARAYTIALEGPDRMISQATVENVLGLPSAGFDHVLLTQPSRFAGLFQLGSPRQPMLGSASFGHDGYTGSLAFGDLHTGTAFAYVCSRPELGPTPHSRITRILTALRECPTS